MNLLRVKRSESFPALDHSWIPREKELAASLLRHGFYLSVGDKFNAEAVKIVPSGRLLAETDDKGCNISEVVRKLAEVRGETCQALCTVLSLNAAHLFFKR